MISKALPLSRFQALAETYGAAISRWPEEERAAALALLQESEAARTLLTGEEGLDALFQGVEPEALPDRLSARLVRVPMERRALRPLRLPRRALWGPAIGWAAAAAVGLWLGARTAEQETVLRETETNETEAVEQSELYAEDELLEVARGTIAGLEELP